MVYPNSFNLTCSYCTVRGEVSFQISRVREGCGVNILDDVVVEEGDLSCDMSDDVSLFLF